MFKNTPFWGEVTSTLDWCEHNYQFSSYIAELANTISNLVTIGLAVHGFRKARAQSLPTRYVASFLGFALVGIGSFAFHATLLYEAQLADELPIYVTTQSLYVLFETVPGSLKDSRRRKPLAIIIGIFNVSFTLLYALYRNPIFHQVVFAMLMLGVAGRATVLSLRPSSPLSGAKRWTISTVLGIGGTMFVLGFLIWNLDNLYCDTLKQWKEDVGWPTAFMLEGHAWWHILTAGGVYLLMVGVQYLTLCLKEGQEKFELAYEMYIPYVSRRFHKEDLKNN